MSSQAQPGDFLQSLKSFEATARWNSQSRAALELGRTQPAISQQIRHLEDELRLPLFSREKNRLVLTDAGQSVYELAREVLDAVDRIYEVSREADQRRKVSLSFLFSLEHDFLPAFLHAMDDRFSDIPIHVHMHLYRDAVQAVLNHSVDVALIMRIPMDDALHFEHLFYADHYIYAPNKKKVFLPDSVDFDFLCAHKLVSTRRGTFLDDSMTALFRQHGRRFVPCRRVKYMATAQSFVLHGLGYGICAGELLRSDRRFKRVSLQNLLPRRDIGILTLKNRDFSSSARTVLDVLRHLGQRFSRDASE